APASWRSGPCALAGAAAARAAASTTRVTNARRDMRTGRLVVHVDALADAHPVEDLARVGHRDAQAAVAVVPGRHLGIAVDGAREGPGIPERREVRAVELAVRVPAGLLAVDPAHSGRSAQPRAPG